MKALTWFRSLSILLMLISMAAGCRKKTLFTRMSSETTGIQFNNTIIENDSVNVLDFENVYNGGGVGIADFNNDGLKDIYFTGNVVPNKLFLNQGHFSFRDITDEAGVSGEGKWSRGVAVVDINNDGLTDIYVCATLKKDPLQRMNMLYVNQGTDKAGIPRFKNMAAAYGLADTSQGTQAAFFDYDNDGDLDMYLVNNEIIKFDFPNRFRRAMKDGSHPNTDKLYRNDWNAALGHPVFTNVSKEAGIQIDGYGHAVTIADFNRDGWKDVYVTNDYLSNDLLWINNRNGTFTDKLSEYFKHTSANAMGNDVADINNDGLADVVVLDMNPEDNFRKKMMMNPNSYQTYQNSDYFGFGYQYVRNTLQLNQGPRVGENDSLGAPVFSDVSFLAGVAETDWSWTPVVADFNNDGNRDIIITNGFPKDVTDHDFVAFRNMSYSVASKKQLLEQIPEVMLHNYAYLNEGNCRFSNVTAAWGLGDASFSNGAVSADLDNDGDLDLVVNNINAEAFIYRNESREQQPEKAHFLNVSLKGDSLNREGHGAWIDLYEAGGRHQVWEYTPYRGYLSSVGGSVHFGLGTTPSIDSLIVHWPNGFRHVMKKISADTSVQLDIRQAAEPYQWSLPMQASGTLFTEVTSALGVQYVHEERDFIDFNIQKLLPHKFSEYGPGLAVGDVDGNGLDDIVTGGSFGFSGRLFLQKPDGRFSEQQLAPDMVGGKRWEELGLLLFDADKDGDLDLYAASGGYENERNSDTYRDVLYVNDGKGHFSRDSVALPAQLTSKSCVRGADIDRDGDIDLLVTGRVDPWNYPKPVSCFLFRNDSKPGKPQFTDITAALAPELNNIGLVCDALFSDFDNDGFQDIVLAGEWMPLTFLKNTDGRFKNITAASGIAEYTGWWNALAPGDFDNDGDLDYVAGNLGLNSFYRAGKNNPVSIFAADFDNNSSLDAFPFLYLPASQEDSTRKLFPAQTRDDLVKQMIGMRSVFQNYRGFAQATVEQVLTPEQRKKALQVSANTLQSCLIRNEGQGRFTLIPLPMEAQVSVLNGMVADDVNGDGWLDLVINGNDYGTEVSVGRYDALNGLVMLGQGNCSFKALPIRESGVFIPGNGKALAQWKSASGKSMLAATQNRGSLKLLQSRYQGRWIAGEPGDVSAMLTFKDGSRQKREFYFGSSFLSQSTRWMQVPESVVEVEIVDYLQRKRSVTLP